MHHSRYKHHLFICNGKSCSQKGDPHACKKFFKEKTKEHNLEHEVRACTCSCLDRCDYGPNIVVYPEEYWYSGVTATDWKEIFEEHVLHSRSVERLQFKGKKT